MTFNFKFSRLFSKNRHLGKLHCTFFTTKVNTLISDEGGKALHIASIIKFVTFDIKLVIATTTFSLKLAVD